MTAASLLRRVVVTGIGAITPIGMGVEGLWDGLQGRRSAIRAITRFDASVFKSRIAGEVDGFHATDHIEERRVRRLDRYSQFTIAATRMALADAHLDLRREDCDRVGAMMGTALGGVAYGEAQYHAFLTRRPARRGSRAGAHRFRRGRKLQHRHRVRLHRPQRHQRDELRVGRHRDRGGVPRHRPGRGGRDDRGRGGGAARSALLRRLLHHPRDVHAERRSGPREPPVRCRPGRVRHGGGLRRAGPGGAGARPCPGRAGLHRDLRLRPHQRRLPHDRAPPRRQSGRPLHAQRAGGGPRRHGGGGLHQCPRVFDPAQRSHGGVFHQAGVRGPRLPTRPERHQGLLRPRARRERRVRGRDLRLGQPTPVVPADREPRAARSRLRPGPRHRRGPAGSIPTTC